MENVFTANEYEKIIEEIKDKYKESLPVYYNAQLMVENGVASNEKMVINMTFTETLAWVLGQFEKKQKTEPTNPIG